ncbi:16S rRNA (cytosine(967)-C(5))-methyltransferase RsmB [Thalassotalea ponticola]|uniref:16S rRNA (cytosine(967)-C(5))-methyltransferase RsmB n=1 Tax=Thalassotalea ponticola TaxID=1523392 RepID=UPI0025B385F1|nr:16S rRNA (cytosine(967)-C(5))-methyltransferase RsmB [Thalassotalea ponticola]MDN3653051.1 16S rRNA (cytosine(967)-C(5))-methyltransferase RsmB [Thalassotalea ponticola]
MSKNVRALAAKCSFAVIDKGRSLSDELPALQAQIESTKDKGLLQELCYGVLRYLPELEFHVRRFVDKPLKGKQRVGHFLLLVGLYQIKYTRIPDHAAVAETVAATAALKCRHLKGMINAVLRSYQRQPDDNTALPDAVRYNHPSWLIQKLKDGYPQQWQDIIAANMQRPDMWIRINKQKTSVDAYLKLLELAQIDISYRDSDSDALCLAHPVDVTKLPHFADGWVSVQDGAAQMAATLLAAQANDRVLDCCAAPGGKTCHILELAPSAHVTAIDIEATRLHRVEENLARLDLTARVICADAAKPTAWHDGELYDKILLDAPCSGTGVIRKNPDIKWLRRASDIDTLVELQQQILAAMWSILKPGGTLLYATCSILPEENSKQIQRFVDNNQDAIWLDISRSTDTTLADDWQILPGEQSMDGFYYAKLQKSANV